MIERLRVEGRWGRLPLDHVAVLDNRINVLLKIDAKRDRINVFENAFPAVSINEPVIDAAGYTRAVIAAVRYEDLICSGHPDAIVQWAIRLR